MRVTWCEQCGQFTAGEGACPECGDSRRGYDAVLAMDHANPRANWRGRGRGNQQSHSHNYERN